MYVTVSKKKQCLAVILLNIVFETVRKDTLFYIILQYTIHNNV